MAMMIIFQAAFETNLWAWRLQEKPSLSISFTLMEKFQWRHCSILCATPWSNLSDQTICLQANWEPQLLWQEFGHYCITQHSNFFWCMVLYIFIQVQTFRTTSAALFESYPFCRTHRVPTYPWYFPSSSSRPVSNYYYNCLIYHIQASGSPQPIHFLKAHVVSYTNSDRNTNTKTMTNTKTPIE